MKPEEREAVIRALEVHAAGEAMVYNLDNSRKAAAELRRLSEGVERLGSSEVMIELPFAIGPNRMTAEELRTRIDYARQLYEGEE